MKLYYLYGMICLISGNVSAQGMERSANGHEFDSSLPIQSLNHRLTSAVNEQSSQKIRLDNLVNEIQELRSLLDAKSVSSTDPSSTVLSTKYLPDCDADSVLKMGPNKQVVCEKEKYTTRYAATSTKGSCGFNSTVMCQPNEVAVSGGMYGGSNIALQSSSAISLNGVPSGWYISALDTWQSICSINMNPNGAIATGSGDINNPPKFPIAGGQSYVSGAAMVVCKQIKP